MMTNVHVAIFAHMRSAFCAALAVKAMFVWTGMQLALRCASREAVSRRRLRALVNFGGMLNVGGDGLVGLKRWETLVPETPRWTCC